MRRRGNGGGRRRQGRFRRSLVCEDKTAGDGSGAYDEGDHGDGRMRHRLFRGVAQENKRGKAEFPLVYLAATGGDITGVAADIDGPVVGVLKLRPRDRLW